jgi:hypothetical protein
MMDRNEKNANCPAQFLADAAVILDVFKRKHPQPPLLFSLIPTW